MGYLIGAGPLDPAVKRYNGGGSSFTMDNSGTTNGTLLWVDGVAQVPGTDYNVSGTTITTTTATGSGTNNVTSLQLFNTGLITTPGDNTVATAKIQDDAVTLAKLAGGTDGNIISYDTSGNPVAVATGNDGQVLTSSGAGAVCAFEDAAGGGLILIGTEEAGGGSGTATLDVTGLDSTYDSYLIQGQDLVPITDNVKGYLRLGDSSGIDSGASDYDNGSTGIYVNAAGAGAQDILEDNDASQILELMPGSNVGGAAGEGVGFSVVLHSPGDGTTMSSVSGTFCGTDQSSGVCLGFCGGARVSVITHDRVQFLFSSGNVETGRLTVWGFKHA